MSIGWSDFLKYSIGEFSCITQLGIHTLRYYEHEHLLTPERNSANRRIYSDKDLVWIEFIKRLKDTGMPIKDIQHYAELRAAGDVTLNERLDILMKHRESLKTKIDQLSDSMLKLDNKIDYYRKEIERMIGD